VGRGDGRRRLRGRRRRRCRPPAALVEHRLDGHARGLRIVQPRQHCRRAALVLGHPSSLAIGCRVRAAKARTRSDIAVNDACRRAKTRRSETSPE
jgi:hypothetical protein